MEQPQFESGFWQDLATENPLGVKSITEQDARDWFDLEWPAIREFYASSRTKKPRWRLRMVRCWSNLTPRSLAAAREFGARRRSAAEAAILAALAEVALGGEFDASEGKLVIPPMRVKGKR